MNASIVCRNLLLALCLLGLAEGFSIASPLEDQQAAGDDTKAAANVKEEVGWLRANSSHPNVDADYALVDKWGAVRCYVRPAEGAHLARFLDRKVRVQGEEIAGPNHGTRLLEVAAIGPPDGPLGRQPLTRRRAPTEADSHVHQAAYTESVSANSAEEIPPGGAPQGGGDFLAPNPQSIDGFDPGPDGYMGDGYDDSYGGGQGSPCGGCNQLSCAHCCRSMCGPRGKIWMRADYLYWFTQGMHVPPLVTTGPSATQPGFLGSPGTQILFGGGTYDGYGRSGGRIIIGSWLNSCQTVGLEGEYFALATATTNFSATSLGNPILSRPFFDTRPTLNNQNVEQVALPGSVTGTVSANIYTQLQSAGLRMRYNLCCSQRCYSDSCLPCLNGPGGCRIDFLLGYRYLWLSDGVSIHENLRSLQPNQPGRFLVNDSFRSQNQFNGVEFGTIIQKYRGRWSFDWLSKLAIGNNHVEANVNGSTTNIQNGVSTTFPGGLLAQRSNIGSYSSNGLALVPELGGNLGYQLTPCLRANLGYTFIFWSRVSRAGEEIDTNVNSTLLPNNPNPPAGDLRHPMFAYNYNSFWAQGVNAGLEYRW